MGLPCAELLKAMVLKAENDKIMFLLVPTSCFIECLVLNAFHIPLLTIACELICLLLFVFLLLCGFCPLGAWDGLLYVIVALPEPSI